MTIYTLLRVLAREPHPRYFEVAYTDDLYVAQTWAARGEDRVFHSLGDLRCDRLCGQAAETVHRNELLCLKCVLAKEQTNADD